MIFPSQSCSQISSYSVSLQAMTYRLAQLADRASKAMAFVIAMKFFTGANSGSLR
jgi:hypothetical protein